MIDVEVLGLRNLRGRFASMTERGLVEHQLTMAFAMAKEAEAIYRDHAPLGQGTGVHFRDTIRGTAVERLGGFEVALSTANPNLRRWLKEGTGIYGPAGVPITPKVARVLTFAWPGGPPGLAGADGLYRFRSVRGMRPNAWEERAWTEVLPLLRIEANKLGARVMSGLAGKP